MFYLNYVGCKVQDAWCYINSWTSFYLNYVAVKLFGVNEHLFWEKMKDIVELYDFIGGLYKAVFFGFIISSVSCYFGFYTQGGTEGVGRATTNSVVTSSMLILISDYFLTAVIF